MLLSQDPAGRREVQHARCAYVTISNADRPARLDYAATVHHGIDTDAFGLDLRPGYLLFFGRIHPDKGTAHVIDIARRVGLPLLIAGIVQDQQYLDEAVARRVDDDHVRYLGPATAYRRPQLLGQAHALLQLVDFDEPFGFSVVEAMACGTPVIAFGRGSMPELIDDGVTGMIVDDLDAAAAAVSLVARLDRATIRETAVRRFGRDRMVDEYGLSMTDRHGPERTWPQRRAVVRFLLRRGIGLTSKLSTSPTVRSRVIASRNGRCS